MAINKKLIHFNSKENFMSALEGTLPEGGAADADHGQLHDYSIVFVKDSKEIWTHDNLYKSVNGTVLEDNTIEEVLTKSSEIIPDDDIENNAITHYPNNYVRRAGSITFWEVKPESGSISAYDGIGLLNTIGDSTNLTPIPISALDPSGIDYSNNKLILTDYAKLGASDAPDMMIGCILITEGEEGVVLHNTIQYFKTN